MATLLALCVKSDLKLNFSESSSSYWGTFHRMWALPQNGSIKFNGTVSFLL